MKTFRIKVSIYEIDESFWFEVQAKNEHDAMNKARAIMSTAVLQII